MIQSPDSRKHISLMLSEVLDDIGVNDRMRMRARRLYKLMETMETKVMKSVGYNYTSYYLGSRIEGTTTLGLKSDTDELYNRNHYNIIQDLSEWEHGKTNFVMIQDENTTPGYCFLQLLQHDKPLPATVVPDKYYITDRKGRILLTNKIYETDNTKYITVTKRGPSIASQGRGELNDDDLVIAYSCKSWPKSAASEWLERQGIGKWPTPYMKRYVASTVCFVVPTGSKVSEYPELEWRISTSLAERCLMFDLDITQIKCYVLMKMILKSLLNPQGEINISSFMCKTILFYCIEQKQPSIWKENNLLECLKDCLMKLSSCVQNDNLSHFIIPENNLIAGQFTADTKHQLLKNICDFIQNDVKSLLRINIDNLGQRLEVNLVPERQYDLLSSLDICEKVSSFNYTTFSMACFNNHCLFLTELHNKAIGIMKLTVESVMAFNNNHNNIEHDAFLYLAPFIFTTYGSVLASESIGLKHQVSPQAWAWLLNGFESDVSSGRLKLASAFYSSGDIEKTELILRQTESQFYSNPVFPICTCLYQESPRKVPAEVMRECNKQKEDCVKNIAAFCVRFLKQEINCVPHELQYELFRSTEDDIKQRDQDEDWMDWATIDSLPFLYFLQYKVFSHLQRYQDQQQALSKLANIIETNKYLGHKETAFNVLGQCMEQENRPKQAIKSYLLSLDLRPINNVAKIHICRLLSSLLVGKKK